MYLENPRSQLFNHAIKTESKCYDVVFKLRAVAVAEPKSNEEWSENRRRMSGNLCYMTHDLSVFLVEQ